MADSKNEVRISRSDFEVLMALKQKSDARETYLKELQAWRMRAHKAYKATNPDDPMPSMRRAS